jgi:hypothetical protein
MGAVTHGLGAPGAQAQARSASVPRPPTSGRPGPGLVDLAARSGQWVTRGPLRTPRSTIARSSEAGARARTVLRVNPDATSAGSGGAITGRDSRRGRAAPPLSRRCAASPTLSGPARSPRARA